MVKILNKTGKSVRIRHLNFKRMTIGEIGKKLLLRIQIVFSSDSELVPKASRTKIILEVVSGLK